MTEAIWICFRLWRVASLIAPKCIILAALIAIASGPVLAQTPTPTPGGDCCAIHNGPSCDDDACSTCVCDVDPVCCVNRWDQFCLATAGDDCAAECRCDRTPSPTPTPGGDCCSPHAGPGCDVQACQDCVCAVDAPCCNNLWDATCVAEAGESCAASCPCEVPPTETPVPTPTPGGDCCAAHGGPSCDEDACAACVCGQDPACCNSVWDGTCAEQAALDCALECPCPAPGDCCAAHEGVSCEETRCKTCVCAIDPACCTDEWDARCADEALLDCPIDCACEDAGDCCAAHDGIGCEIEVCQDCVCALDELCCTELWDGTCADVASAECAERCGACAPSDCCAPREEPGCAAAPCEDCVCAIDSFCCDDLWDGGCVDIAEEECPAECACGAVPVCPGDCANDGEVSVNELITAVNIALGNAPLSTCSAIDTNGDGSVTVNELIQAVNAALDGCPAA